MRTILVKIVLFSGLTLVASVLLAMLFDPGTQDERAFAEMLVEQANPSIPSPCTIPRSADGRRFVDREVTPTPFDLRSANLIMASRPRPSNWNSD